MKDQCFAEDGAPLKCDACGCSDFQEKVRSSIDVGVGRGIPCEIEYLCARCGVSVAYWAYGSFDPTYKDKL